MKTQFSRFIFGTLERDGPLDVALLPDRMILDWGMWFWKSHKEIPWQELTIVPAAAVWLGDHPGWNSDGITLRWNTSAEPHRGWKRIWLPCPPGSPFHAEIQRLQRFPSD
jgi:hypothetical protein